MQLRSKCHSLYLALSLFIGANCTAYAGDIAPVVPTSNTTYASSSTDFDPDGLSSVIRSRADLDRYLEIMTATPFDGMPADARATFVSSLVFSDDGLASYSYLPILEHLSASDAYRLLSLFGSQKSVTSIIGWRVETPEDAAVIGYAKDWNSRYAEGIRARSRADYICDSGNGPERCRYSFGNVCGDRCGKRR